MGENMKSELMQLKKRFEEELEEDMELVKDSDFWQAVEKAEKKINLRHGSLEDLKIAISF